MICTTCNKDKLESSFYPGHTVCKSCYYHKNKKTKKQIEAEDDDRIYSIGARCLGGR